MTVVNQNQIKGEAVDKHREGEMHLMKWRHTEAAAERLIKEGRCMRWIGIEDNQNPSVICVILLEIIIVISIDLIPFQP